MTRDLSVVIPTHDRRDSLLRLLDALHRGTLPPDRFEVVVVADGCTDDTVERARAAALPFPVRVLEQTPGRGAAAARNLGARHAEGRIIVFIDDDIEPLPTLLEAHLRAHEEGEGRVVIGPPIPVRGERPDYHALAAWTWWEEQFERMRRPGHRFGYADVFTGILSVPAALFRAAGEFDVAFDNCRDDFELGLRLIGRGATLVFREDAGGVHHELRDRARLARRKRAEGVADVRLARRHPALWPALRIAAPEPALLSPLGVMRRLALSAPWLGDPAARLLAALLPPLERIGARGSWRAAHAGAMYYWYWRGVGDAAGSRRALRVLAEMCATHPAPPPRELAVDLRDGLADAELRLDRRRPDALRILWDGREIGRVAPRPGAEPLRGAHLRRLLHDELREPLLRALVAADAAGDLAAPSRTTIHPSSGWRAIRSGDGRHAPYAGLTPLRVLDVDVGGGLRDQPGDGVARGARVLVRRCGRPLGWTTVMRDGGAVLVEDVRAALEGALHHPLARDLLRDAIGEVPAPLPPISVVVCTRDRAASLARCLRSLAALDYPDWELVVVDNASRDDATARAAAAHGARCVREERPGLDWARNRGVAESRHDIVAFTDDDVEVDPQWLRGLAHAFADPSVELVTGLVAPARMETEAEVMFELGYGGMGKGAAATHRDGRAMPASALLGAHHLGVGANMAFRRALLERLGGFDTALDVGTPAHGGGDLDIFHRALAAGAAARYEPRALVWHHHRRDLDALARLHRDNGRAFGAYLLAAAARRTVPRASVARYAAVTWLGWLLARPPMRLARRERLPMPLLLAELRGAAESPWAWAAARRRDRRIRGGARDEG